MHRHSKRNGGLGQDGWMDGRPSVRPALREGGRKDAFRVIIAGFRVAARETSQMKALWREAGRKRVSEEVRERERQQQIDIPNAVYVSSLILDQPQDIGEGVVRRREEQKERREEKEVSRGQKRDDPQVVVV
jgi:hypothetical protein